MLLYNSIAFWKWLDSSGYKPLPDSQLEVLKTSFEYTHKQVTSEYEHERVTWDYKRNTSKSDRYQPKPYE